MEQNKPTLISIDNDLKQLLASIEQSGGEITPEQEEQLMQLIQASKSKVSSYCFILDAMDNEIDFVNAQIKIADDYIHKIQRQKEKLEQIALKVLEFRSEKLEGENGRWLGKRKSTRLIITDEDKISPVYMRMTPSIDKQRIKSDLEAGIQCDGAELKTNFNLSWK